MMLMPRPLEFLERVYVRIEFADNVNSGCA